PPRTSPRSSASASRRTCPSPRSVRSPERAPTRERSVMTTTTNATLPPPPIRPRAPRMAFDPATIERHWLGGNALGTHLINGVNLLFPEGERYFVRSVVRYLDRVDDPALRERVRGFFGQEGRHAAAHQAFFEVLTAQGYPVDRFARMFERWMFERIERV